MNVPLSIITINLNDSRGLQKTIASVVNQSYNLFEYIVIDGGSTDSSVDVIRKYEDEVSWWVSEKDAGIYNAMNKGLSKATGDFCLFLNSGDYLESSDSLKKVAEFFSENIDIVYGDLILDFGNRKEIKTFPNSFTLYNFVDASLPHPSSFIRTSLLKKLGGYDEDFKIVSDWIFFLRAFMEENAAMKKVEDVISVHNMFGISCRPNEFGREPEEALLKYYPILKADFTHFRELRYYEASRPHQLLKEILVKTKRVFKLMRQPISKTSV
jgi:glycosyltransferase involved in cell wall biosynthesis